MDTRLFPNRGAELSRNIGSAPDLPLPWGGRAAGGVDDEDRLAYHSEQQIKSAELQEVKDAQFQSEDVFNPPIIPGLTPERTKVLEVTTSYGNTFNIYQFTSGMILPDFTCGFYGKRRTGKSFLMMSLLWHLRSKFPHVVVFTATKHTGEWTTFLPDCCVVQGFDHGVLANLIKHQCNLLKLKLAGKLDPSINTRLLIIFDDCLSEGFRYQKLLHNLFFNGRHFNTCIFISSQDTKGLPPALTANLDIACSYRVNSERDKESLRTKFADYFKNDREFTELMAPIVDQKYHAIFFDQSNPHMPPSECVYAGRAVPWEPYILGCRDMWKGSFRQLKMMGWEAMIYCEDWGIEKELTPRELSGHQKQIDARSLRNMLRSDFTHGYQTEGVSMQAAKSIPDKPKKQKKEEKPQKEGEVVVKK